MTEPYLYPQVRACVHIAHVIHVEVKFLHVCVPLPGDVSFLFFWSKVEMMMTEILHERIRTKQREGKRESESGWNAAGARTRMGARVVALVSWCRPLPPPLRRRSPICLQI